VSVLEKVRQLNPFTTLLAPLAIFLQIISSGRGQPLFLMSTGCLWIFCFVEFLSITCVHGIFTCGKDRPIYIYMRTVRFGFNLEYVV